MKFTNEKRITTMSKNEFQAATAPDREVEAIMTNWKGNRNRSLSNRLAGYKVA